MQITVRQFMAVVMGIALMGFVISCASTGTQSKGSEAAPKKTGFLHGHPALSGVTSVVPVGLAINIVKKGATDSWTGSGATTAEMMVLDSMTNEVLGAGEDQMAAGFTERFTKWGSVEEAFEFWGERLAKRLVNFTKKK